MDKKEDCWLISSILSGPLSGSNGGAVGKQIKDTARVSGEVFDKIIGVVIVLIGIYFLYLAFR
jgi:hypothetical protein